MPTYTNDWFGSTALENFQSIVPHVAGKAVRVLEIGSFEGRSSNWIVENICTHPASRLTCADPFTGSSEHTQAERDGLYDRFLSNVSHNLSKIRVVKKTSLEALTSLIALGEKFDVVYIDGDHRNMSVMLDMILVDRVLEVGGIMIVDDYAWKTSSEDYLPPHERPKEAIDYFFSINKHKYDIVGVNWQVGAVKKSD